MAGWIKLHRQIVSSSKFADPDILRLWILCLTKATHKDKVTVIERQEIPLLPGQFVTGRFALEQEYNAVLSPRKRIKDTTLWSWLKRLEEWGDLDINSTNKYSVVTVLKWSDYQDTLTTEPQQIDNNLTAKLQQTDTNKNVKKDKNDKKVKEVKTYTPEFDEFWNVYPRKLGKVECFKTWEKVLKTGEQPIFIIQCATNYAKDCEMKKTEDRFIKHPKTFLNDERYKDYKIIAIGGANNGQQPSYSGNAHANTEQDFDIFVLRQQG